MALASTPWPRYKRDNRNTGYSPYNIGPEVKLKWRHSTGGGSGCASIGPDGTVYVQGWDGYLYAFGRDGTVKWTYYTGGGDGSPAIGDDGTVYVVGDWGDCLYAINPDGALKWEYPAPYLGCCPVIGNDGTLYIAHASDPGPSGSMYLSAIDADGNQKWRYPLQCAGITLEVALDSANGIVYTRGTDGLDLYAINLDGELEWTYPNVRVRVPPSIGTDGTVYVEGDEYVVEDGIWIAYLYAIGPDGTFRWRYCVGNGYGQYGEYAIGATGTIYVLSYYNYELQLYALNPDGTVRAHCSLPTVGASGYSFTVAGNDDTLLIGSSNGTLYALNLDEDQGAILKWEYNTGSYIYAHPVVDKNGTVYVQNYGGYFYALEAPELAPRLAIRPQRTNPMLWLTTIMNGD